MEAVGAVASIVGIATFGFELAKTLKTYVDTVVDADDILRDLTFEIETTAKIIEQLNNFVKEDNADSTRTRTRVLSEQASSTHLKKVRLRVIVESSNFPLKKPQSKGIEKT
ncbi:hypothetical protein F4809DRAFT_647183 [Biscogniauxia mediterranea]|nr:hypothetical protein F4809DRAFT_647183 [Biscogniauxia mediterranea]